DGSRKHGGSHANAKGACRESRRLISAHFSADEKFGSEPKIEQPKSIGGIFRHVLYKRRGGAKVCEESSNPPSYQSMALSRPLSYGPLITSTARPKSTHWNWSQQAMQC